MLSVRHAVALVLPCLVCALPSRSQPQDYTKPINDHRAQPEVWQFAKPAEPGVDAHGDLGLSVPLMTVPGRGLDFPITLSYRSGITWGQPASWVGLGWNFTAGSITREPVGGATYQPEGGGDPVAYGVDEFSVDSIAVGVDTVDAFFEGLRVQPSSVLPDAMPDLYFASLPGRGAAELTRIMNPAHTYQALPEAGQGDFIVNGHKPWQIAATASQGAGVVVGGLRTGTWTQHHVLEEQADIEEFVITTEDGTRYVFAAPTLKHFLTLDARDRLISQVYVNTWRLVAILGPDYVGDAPPGPPYEADGPWVVLEYSDPITATRDDADNWYRLVHQVRYLEKVITPTHEAVFMREDHREGLDEWLPLAVRGSGLEQEVQQRLARVALYSRLDGSALPVREVTLHHDKTLGPAGSLGGGQRALKGIQIDEGALGTYAFEYYDGDEFTAFNPDGQAPESSQDHFGYLYDRSGGTSTGYDTTAAHAWSLKRVTYPTGGWEEFAYENDQIADVDIRYTLYRGGQDLEAPIVEEKEYCVADTSICGANPYGKPRDRQGGPRVTEIQRYDGVGGPPSSTTYAYGPGRLTGVPPEHWRYVQDVYGQTVRLYQPSRRGQVSVVYETVTKTLPNGSSVVTEYSTPATHGDVRRIGTYALIWNWDSYSPCGTPLFDLSGKQTYQCTDFAVVQGNEHRLWGLPLQTDVYGADGRQTKRAKRTLTHYTGGVPPIAYAWNGPLATSGDRVAVEFGSLRLSREVTTLYYPGDVRYGWATAYEYDNDTRTGLLRDRIEEYGVGQRRWTRTHYAFERSAVADGLKARNMLSQVAASEVLSGGAGVTYHRASATAWEKEGGRYRPNAQYVWRADGPAGSSPVASFDAWGGGPAGGGWIRTVSYEAYDDHGRPVGLVDARGTATSLFYGDNAEPFSNGAGGLAQAYLTGVRQGGLELSMAYDPSLGLATSVTDANGHTSTFRYDAYGRLEEARNASGETVATHAYAFLTSASQPNEVRTELYRSTGESTVTVAYLDGLGRPIQSVLSGGGSSIHAATTYDPMGREARSYKPYGSPSGPSFDDAFDANASSYYDGNPGPEAGGRPFLETEYRNDGLGRPAATRPEGAASPWVTFDYGVGTIEEVRAAFTETADEEGRISREYRDELGRTIGTVADVGGELEATTTFVYDVTDDLLEVRPPNHHAKGGYVTTYTHNTLGQLVRKETPDTEGLALYAYDAAGHLRKTRDPERSGGGYLFANYDGLGRLVEEGYCEGSLFTEGELVGFGDACSSGSKLEVVQHLYDAEPDPMPAGVALRNLNGRLAATITADDKTYYSYDAEGRVEDVYVQLGGLGLKHVSYAYDRQGNVTEVAYQAGVPEESFHHWYGYDDLGRLREVRTSRDATRPTDAAEAVYDYTAMGQVERLRLGCALSGGAPTDCAQTLDYGYHVRGWLTALNDVGDLGDDAFALRLGYDDDTGAPSSAHVRADGNVSWAEWEHAAESRLTTPARRVAYTFAYDGLSRLQGADFYTRSGSGWDRETAYDLADVTYDLNGNIEALVRNVRERNADGVFETLAQTLTYTYAPGTNRIDEVAGLEGGAVRFDYDANGNATAGRGFEAARYDRRNLPTALTTTGAGGGLAMTFRYDAGGQRVFKASASSSSGEVGTYYVRGVDGGVLAVYDGAGTVLHWNIRAGGDVIGRLGRVAPPR